MEIIKFLGKGTGLGVLLAVLAVILIGITILVKKSSKRKHTGRIVFPVFFIELGILFLIITLGFPDVNEKVGPGVVPMLWIIGILGLSLLLLIRGLLGLEDEDPPWGHTGKVAIFIVMIILYIIIMQVIGYYLATALFLISGMYFLTYRNWKVMISISAGWTLFSYFAFYRLLYVPLPRGLLIDWIFG
jgi:putative tricarboxylic transport membrane protein